MNILILSGKFGMGHWSASLSLRQQLLTQFPDAKVEIVEFYNYALSPLLCKPMYHVFSLLVSHGGTLYNKFYRLAEQQQTDALPRFPRAMVDKLSELVDESAPDVVIATHPVCAQIVSRYKQEYHASLPLVTCVTDLTSHSEWLCPGTDCYMVGAPEIKAALLKKGVEESKILVTGIPVRAEFFCDTHRARRRTRRLLVMGGGLGLMPRQDSFYRALDALRGAEVIVITGKNERLYRRLRGQYDNIRVVGYTDRVYEYMARADLVLTKPGGVTIFEAICSGLPILAWQPKLEQEVANAEFLAASGVGRIARTDDASCLEDLCALLYDEAALAEMSARMSALTGRLTTDGLCLWLASLQEVCV